MGRIGASLDAHLLMNHVSISEQKQNINILHIQYERFASYSMIPMILMNSTPNFKTSNFERTVISLFLNITTLSHYTGRKHV